MKAFRYEPAGGSLRYFDLPGVEPPLVFLHGLGAAVVPAFLDVAHVFPLNTHRRILIDLLGHGFSDRPEGFGYTMEQQAEAVVRLLAGLGGARPILVGHSMGGSIAILVSANTDRVSHLIVAEPNLDPGPGVISGPITAFTESDFVARGHRKLSAAIEEAGFGAYAAVFRISDSRALHRSAVSLVAPRDPSFRQALLRLSVRRTFLAGERSHDVRELSGLAIEGIDVAAVSEAGHDMMWDNPAGFAAAIGAAIS